MASKSVAIDIGATHVRVAEVELRNGIDGRDGASLIALSERPVPAGIIREGRIEEPGAFGTLVKEAVASAKVSPKDAVIALGHPTVMVREVDVPSQPLSEVRSSLAFHVQDSLPMAVDEAILDFYPTQEIEAASGPMLRGMLVAAPSDLVRDTITALDGTGVGLSRVDHSAFALWRAAVRGELMNANVAVVDVGAETTTVVVSQRGLPRLVRVLPQGGGDATRAIASAFKGQGVDAERLKIEVGMGASVAGDQRQVADAVNHVMAPLIESVRNTLVYFASSNPGGAVESLVMTGGGAYLNGLGQAIASATRLPVRIGEPLAGVAVGKKVDISAFRGREATLATVIGLAMGGAA